MVSRCSADWASCCCCCRLSPPLAELLVLTLVAAWVCYDLAAFDRRSSSSAHSHGAAGGGSSHKIEALILFMLALAGHAGMGPSQFRCAGRQASRLL